MNEHSSQRLPPTQILRRAPNLLASNGQPVSAIQDMTTQLESGGNISSQEVVHSKNRNDNNGLGASIKRQLSKVKTAPLTRSKSSRSNDDPLLKRKHARAQSDLVKLSASWVTPTSVVAPHNSNVTQNTPTAGFQSGDRQKSMEQVAQAASMADVAVPLLLQQGVPMTKVSAKKQKSYIFQLDPDQGQILWESKKPKIIPIENIKELRSCTDARYYRQQFQLAQEYEDRWLTIIYIMEGQYKTLHLIASTKDLFQMWDNTLRRLFAIRQELMSGLGNLETRQAIWERRCWKGADDQNDQRLEFEEAEKLCKRLNIHSSREDLLRLFKEADTQGRGFLDFTDFQRFVKLLKARPELNRLYKKLCYVNGGTFDFVAFEKFMRGTQKSSLKTGEMEHVFLRYASPLSQRKYSNSSLSSDILDSESPLYSSPSGITKSQSISDSPIPSQLDTSINLATSVKSSLADYHLTLDGFTAFLLSCDNSVFTDQHGKIWHDMTRPISEYFISSSHNTYLVGHQLVGMSTIEGYIRALLHSCRSVELDIYDGDVEPMIFHGKTLTTKVPLREVCQAITKYAFATSPYPIIISAEIHCSLNQQDMIANIMSEVFGDALVSAPIDGRPKIEALPSPEDLKGRILLKAKNLCVSEHEPMKSKDITVDTESSTETSASESEITHELKVEIKRARELEQDAVKELKEEFHKARGVFGRVRRHQKSTSSVIGPATATSTALLEQQISTPSQTSKSKVKMSFAVAALLVYTVGVKCRGINKKEQYAPEHVFSLSESTANKILKQNMMDLIKHNKTHLVRVYPKGLRLNSTNYVPHRYWSAGAQLVAINWQTFDLGYMLNHAMFQRNGRSGYVLKPTALRSDKELLSKRTKHYLEVTIISAQQLPRPKDSSGRELPDKSIVNPYVEVSIHIPDWTHSPFVPHASASLDSQASGSESPTPTGARTLTYRTSVVKNNGFNPVWQETLSLPFDCVGEMKDLIFVRFSVRNDGDSEEEPIAVYCVSLGSLEHGFRHLPLHDAQLSQYLFSTLFVNTTIHDA